MQREIAHRKRSILHDADYGSMPRGTGARRAQVTAVNRTFINFTTAFLGIVLVSFTLVFLTYLVGQERALRTEDLGARQSGVSPAR